MLYDLLLNQARQKFVDFNNLIPGSIPQMKIWPDDIEAAVPFNIGQVAANYYNHPRDYTPHEFDNVAPRYPRMWFEFSQPERGNNDGEWVDYAKEIKEVMGENYDITRIIWGVYVRCWDRFNELESVKLNHPRVDKETRWLCRAMIFNTFGDGNIDPRFTGMTWQVDGTGRIIFFNRDPEAPYMFDFQKKMLAHLTMDDIKAHVSGKLIPVFMALAMIHCKNIVVNTVQSQVKTPKRLLQVGTRQARRAAKRLPRDRSYRAHHIIVIDPAKTPGQKGGQGKGDGTRPLPWHLMPGQFRTYGGVDPVSGKRRGLLFGKYSGTFYVPYHVRGGKDDGRVTKEYEVKNAD